MIPKWETASSRLILTTISAKKEIIQANWTIIIPNMIGMGFCAGLFFPSEIETEIFSASMAEFKGILIQDSSADLTVTDFYNAPPR
jgi:hypothetical protein